MKIYNIKWETDGESVDLPTEVLVTEKTLVSKGYITANMDDEEKFDCLADYLSDEYGFLICSFSAEVKKMPNKIQSFYIGSEDGSGMEFKSEDEFFRALKEKIIEAAEAGKTHFDVTIELAE